MKHLGKLSGEVESPRHPLQHSPHPSPRRNMTTVFPASSFTHLSPTRHESPTKKMRPVNVIEHHDRVDMMLLTQRLASIEDRFSNLESLVSRLAGKLDTHLLSQDIERKTNAALELRLEKLEGQQVALQKATSDFGNRILEHSKVLSSTTNLQQMCEKITTVSLPHTDERIEEAYRLLRIQDHDHAKQLSQLRIHIAQLTKLLQNYTRKQCDTLSIETAARLDSFEKDRHEMIGQIAEVSHGMNETRVLLSDFRAQVATVDRSVRQQHDTSRDLAEELKILQRRLLSALRHLSLDANSFLSVCVSETTAQAQALAPPEASNSESTRILDKPSHAPDSGTGDESIDQFLAELNFMSRNAL